MLLNLFYKVLDSILNTVVMLEESTTDSEGCWQVQKTLSNNPIKPKKIYIMVRSNFRTFNLPASFPRVRCVIIMWLMPLIISQHGIHFPPTSKLVLNFTTAAISLHDVSLLLDFHCLVSILLNRCVLLI